MVGGGKGGFIVFVSSSRFFVIRQVEETGGEGGKREVGLRWGYLNSNPERK